MTLQEIIESKFDSKVHFANEIGVSRFTIYNWLKNPKLIRLKHLEKISSTSGVDLRELISSNINSKK